MGKVGVRLSPRGLKTKDKNLSISNLYLRHRQRIPPCRALNGQTGSRVGHIIQTEEERVLARRRVCGHEDAVIVHHHLAWLPDGGEIQSAAGFTVALRNKLPVSIKQVQKDFIALL